MTVVSYPDRGGILPRSPWQELGLPAALCRQKGTSAKLGLGLLAGRALLAFHSWLLNQGAWSNSAFYRLSPETIAVEHY